MRSLLPLAAALALAGGCGPGALEQEAAERAVAREVGSREVECTGRSGRWFTDGPPAEVFVCAAKVGNGLCDRYRVDRDGDAYRIAVVERSGSCTLPTG